MKELTAEKKEHIEGMVECLENDILSMMYAVDNGGEPPWDINDRDNWNSLLVTIEEMKDLLELQTNPAPSFDFNEEEEEIP